MDNPKSIAEMRQRRYRCRYGLAVGVQAESLMKISDSYGAEP